MTATLVEDELLCNHNCEVTQEALRGEHYTDCPVFDAMLCRFVNEVDF